jgi:hypothetical protein
MTEMLVQFLFCFWATSRSGITAAFLYWGGYFAMICWAIFWFSALSLKGILGLL